MIVSIKLTNAEVKGIKAYITETEGKIATNKDVIELVKSLKDILYEPQEAVSDYINKENESQGLLRKD